MQPACLSQLSVPKVYCSLLFRRTNTGGDMSFSLSNSRNPSYSLARATGSLACDSQSHYDSGDAILPKSAARRLNTLQSSQNKLNLVILVPTCYLRVASAVWSATSSFSELGTWPR